MNDYIEFHDAIVGSVNVLPGDKCSIVFEHLNVYDKIDETTAKIYGWKASILLNGIGSLVKQGSFEERDVLDDLIVKDVDGEEVDPMSLVQREIQDFELQFCSGGKISIEAKEMKIDLLEKNGFVENWDGPI